MSAISDFVKQEPPPIEEQVSDEIVNEYVEWRAYMQPIDSAASLCGITREQALKIEKSESFTEEIDKIRKEVEDDPNSAIRSLMPRSIGVLRAELARGNIAAAREVSRLNTLIKKEEPDDGEDKRPTRATPQRRKIAETALGISQGKPDS